MLFFYASSIERTIFTYCDNAANSEEMMPNWLVPVQFRIIPTNIENAIKLGKQLEMQYRVEVDDRDINEKKNWKMLFLLKFHILFVLDKVLKFIIITQKSSKLQILKI